MTRITDEMLQKAYAAARAVHFEIGGWRAEPQIKAALEAVEAELCTPLDALVSKWREQSDYSSQGKLLHDLANELETALRGEP